MPPAVPAGMLALLEAYGVKIASRHWAEQRELLANSSPAARCHRLCQQGCWRSGGETVSGHAADHGSFQECFSEFVGF